MKQLVGIALSLWTAAIFVSSATADPIYRNSTNDNLIRFNPGTLEVGDQIVLAGSARYLTNFSFEFYGTNTANPFAFAGNIMAEVKFYLNDGPAFNGYATPGTLFYDSGLFAVSSPTPRSTFIFTAGNDFASTGLFIPGNELTWSVQFSGMGATDSVGLDLYSPPTVGANYPDYWEKNGTWALKTNSIAANMNFGATFDASVEAVPEPSIAIISIVGGALGLGFANRIRSRRA